MSADNTDIIRSTIPHRLRFLDHIHFVEHPMEYDDSMDPTMAVPANGIAADADSVQQEVGVPRIMRPMRCGGRIGPPPNKRP